MKFLSKFFKKDRIECPRCLGKAHVDMDDIKRLNKELKWVPGECAYCDGTGIVDANLPFNLPADTTYLNVNRTKEERRKLKTLDEDELTRAKYHDIKADRLIKEINYLYNHGNMNEYQISDFYYLHDDEPEKKRWSQKRIYRLYKASN